MKNVKFSYTVNSSKFPILLSKLLDKQLKETTANLHFVQEAVAHLKNREYDDFFERASKARDNLELLLMALNDCEENMRALLDAEVEKPKEKQPAEEKEPTAEVVSEQTNPFQQLQQLQQLVNTIKELNPA